MAEQTKTYKAARPVIIGGKTYFTGQSVALTPAAAGALVASGQIYEPETEKKAPEPEKPSVPAQPEPEPAEGPKE